MDRLFYVLLAILVILALPIVWEIFRHGQPMGNELGLLILISSFFSGPSLVLYSLLVYHFTEGKAKKILCGTGLLIGLPWTIFLMYIAGQGFD